MPAYSVEKWILEQMERGEEFKIVDIGDDTFVTNYKVGFLNDLLQMFTRNFPVENLVDLAKSYEDKEPVAEVWFDKRLLIQALDSLSDPFVKLSLFQDGDKHHTIDLSTFWSHAVVKSLDGNQMTEDVKTLYQTVLASVAKMEATEPKQETKRDPCLGLFL